MARNRGGGQDQGQGQQKSSRLFELVLDHAPAELAKWQADNSVSDEDYRKMLTLQQKFLDGLMRSGSKAFPAVAAEFLAIAKRENFLSEGLLTSLNDDVFSKATEAIAKAEKEKAEAAKEKSEADKKKKKTDEDAKEAEKAKNEIRTADQFLVRIPNAKWQETATERLAIFATALTPDEATKFAEGLIKGDQRAKFACIVRYADVNQAIALARANGWI